MTDISTKYPWLNITPKWWNLELFRKKNDRVILHNIKLYFKAQELNIKETK